MPSFKTIAVAVAAAFVATASADYYIDPKSVPRQTRLAWCADEKRTCPIICQQTKPGTTLVNDCDPDTLTYGCICGDGKQPDVEEFTLTLPYHVCTEWGTQCVKACGSNNICAANCREQNPCGAQEPKLQNATTTAASPNTSPTVDPNTVFTDVPGRSDSPNGAPASAELGRVYGLAAVLGSLVAGVAMML